MDLDQLVDSKLGPGPWLEIDSARVDQYWEAVGGPGEGPSLLFLVSLLPALASGLVFAVATPRATINYGLNQVRSAEPVAIGDRVRMTASVSKAEWVGDPDHSPLQIVRGVEVENQRSEVVLTAEIVSRLVY